MGSARSSALTRRAGIFALALFVAWACMGVATAFAVAPANDDFANATVLTDDFGSITGTNMEATTQTAEPGVAFGTIWYSFTPAVSGVLALDTLGSNFDTVLDLYSGTAVDSLVWIAGNDDTSESLQSRVTTVVAAGVTYSIRVSGYWDEEELDGSDGATKLNWSVTAPSTISGNVTQAAAGTALSGVRVSCYRKTSSGYFSEVGEALTDALGNYTLTNLVPGDYQVYFEGDSTYLGEYFDGKLEGFTVVPLAEDQDLTGVNASLEKAGSLSGEVTNRAGDPVEYPWLDLYRQTAYGWDYSGYADADDVGAYSFSRLAAGEYTVWAYDQNETYAPQYYSGKSSLESADSTTVAFGQAVSGVDLSLYSWSASVSGHVVNTASEDLEYISVYLYMRGDSGVWEWLDTTETEWDGTYSFGGLLAGREYTVGFKDQDMGEYIAQYYDDEPSLQTAEGVAIDEGASASMDATLAAYTYSTWPNGTGKITGSVTHGWGEPLAGADVYIYTWDGFGWSWVQNFRTGADGSYEATGLAAGPYRVEYNSDGGYITSYYSWAQTIDGGMNVNVAEGATVSDIDGYLEMGGSVTGTVTDKLTGDPISGAEVQLLKLGEEGFEDTEWWTIASPDGSYSFDSVVPGTYTVQVYGGSGYLSGYFDSAYSLDDASTFDVWSESEASGIDVALVKSASVSGRVTDRAGNPLSNVSVTLCSKYDEWDDWSEADSAMTGATGAYSFSGIAPGIYTVWFSASGDQEDYEFAEPSIYADQGYFEQHDLDHAKGFQLDSGESLTGIDAALWLRTVEPPRTNDDLLFGWQPTAQEVTLYASQPVPGATGATFYQINNGAVMTYADPLFFSYEGITNLKYWSVDDMGRKETTRSVDVMVDAKSKVISRFSTTSTLTKRTVSYNGTTYIYGRLLNDSGVAFAPADKPLMLMSSTDGEYWEPASAEVTITSGWWKFTAKTRENTFFRVDFAQDSENAAHSGPKMTVYTRAYLTKPKMGTTSARLNRSVSAYSYLKPYHMAGLKSVKFLCYHYESGKWVRRMTVYAKNADYNYGDYTKASASMKFSRAGKWRIYAYHSDGGHAATKTSYQAVTVR